jgi:serine/threonine protein kinase
MKSPSPLSRPSAAKDAALAGLMEEITNRLNAGEPVDVEAYAAAHPGCAEELRRLAPALVALAAWSGSGGQPGPAPAAAGGELGDFRILREVGRGGMGVVYEAEQLSLGRRVALKVLPFAATMDPKHLQRFHNEARAAASLHHEHIVPVYAVGQERGVHFYAMQFIEGRSVAEVIARQRGASEPRPCGSGEETAAVAAAPTEPAPRDAAYFRRVAELGIQAANALQHAHENGVIHRDVKPANLLVDTRGKLWVTDFGLAQVQADGGLTRTGDLVGTLRYASPEQALGKRELVDHRTDIYGLGATLYELLTLRPAMEGRDRQELFRRIAFEEPRAPRRHHPGLPVDLETIILKAMAKEPRERYATVGDLADDLRRFLERRPIHARRPTVWQRASRWAGRHQRVVLAALAGLLVVMSSLALSAWQIERAREEAVRQRDVAEENARDVAARERELRHRLYPADINLAHRLWQLGNHAQAREVLRRQVPEKGQEDLRGFEWYFLWDRCRRGEPRTLRGHRHAYDVAISPDGKTKLSYFVEKSKGRVYDIAFSPDGKTLATASQDCTVGLWDVEGGQLLSMLGGHAKEVDCVWFSPDGRVLASHSGDGTIHLWNVATRRRLKVLAREGADVCGVYFRPDGRLITSVYRKGPMRMEIWDPQTGARRNLGGARNPLSPEGGRTKVDLRGAVARTRM